MSYVKWFSSLTARAGLMLLISAMVSIPAGPCSLYAAEGTVVLDDTKKEEIVLDVPEQPGDELTIPQEKKTADLSTSEMVGIGVGAVAVVGGLVALAGRGGSDSSSGSSTTYPTKKDIVGVWYAKGTRVVGELATYTGTYTFYANGTHKYDLYFSDGRHKVDGGRWVLVKNYFRLWNNSGSSYKGRFKNGDYSQIDVATTDGRWITALKKIGN